MPVFYIFVLKMGIINFLVWNRNKYTVIVKLIPLVTTSIFFPLQIKCQHYQFCVLWENRIIECLFKTEEIHFVINTTTNKKAQKSNLKKFYCTRIQLQSDFWAHLFHVFTLFHFNIANSPQCEKL